MRDCNSSICSCFSLQSFCNDDIVNDDLLTVESYELTFDSNSRIRERN
jgi:hypothetical protein